MGRLIYLRDVVTLELDADRCSGCGMCLTVCPRAVFGFEDKKVFIAEKNACIECGACKMNCPAGAVSVRAGVGCAAAVVNAYLGRSGASCCCVVEEDKTCGQ